MSISSNLNGVTQLGSWTFTLSSLPPNAAQETGGALAYLTRMVELNTQILAELRALRLQQAEVYGIAVDPSQVIDDFIFN